MKSKINAVLKMDKDSFNSLPEVVKQMTLKDGKVRIIRIIKSTNLNSEFIVEPFYKPISKMSYRDA